MKSGDSNVKEETIQSLKGTMDEGDYGFFITLSDFTKNGYKYLENHRIIKGINGAELVDLILKYYDKLSDKYQDMIPLEMVYIPVPKDHTNNIIMPEMGKKDNLDYRDSNPIPEWLMTACELEHISKHYSAIHAYADKFSMADMKDAFYPCSFQAIDIAMRENMSGGLPITGFYEMKQKIYEIALELNK